MKYCFLFRILGYLTYYCLSINFYYLIFIFVNKKQSNIITMKYKIIKIKTISSAFLIACLTSIQGWSATYFIDSVSGDDNNSGMSGALSWKTIDKVNATLLLPGDRVRFKANQTIAGKIFLNQVSGTEESPILIDSYGGSANSRALIDGSGY